MYFDHKDFECLCGCGYNAISPEVIRRLNAVGREVEGSIRIMNACMCPSYSSDVKAKANNPHTKGLAVDIFLEGKNDEQLIDACKKHFPHIEVSDVHIHLDIDHALVSR